MKRSPLKIAMVVLAYLAAGAVANVVVAAACALWMPVGEVYDINYAKIPAFAIRWTPREWIENPLDYQTRSGSQWDVTVQDARAVGVQFLEIAGREHPPPGITLRPVKETVVVIRAGWPWTCLEAASERAHEVWRGTPGIRAFSPVLSLPASSQVKPRSAVNRGDLIDLRVVPAAVVPASPVWPAIVANTVVWALILAFFVNAPRRLRAEWRLRRGMCPRCAYPIGVSANCTECGHALPRWMIQMRMPEGAAAPSGTSPAESQEAERTT